jgi:hypothetical protein
MRAGTLDTREDRYFTWTLLRLDQRGWEKVAGATRRLSALVLEGEELARNRIEQCEEKPVRTTVAFSAFESPEPPREP